MMYVYLLSYSVVMVGIFAILSALRFSFYLAILSKQTIFLNMFKINPILALCFAIFLFSLSSIPPLIGFFGKFILYAGSLVENVVLVGIIFILIGLIVTYVYLRFLKLIFFVNQDNSNK